MHQLGLKTCMDLQQLPLPELVNHFGKFGQQLYERCRGIDHRLIVPNRERKSLSVEHTFPEDISDRDICLGALKVLQEKLLARVEQHAPTQMIKNQYIKIKFSNFRLVSAETISSEINFELFKAMFFDAYAKVKLPIRLLGVGVHFCDKESAKFQQQTLF